MKINIDSWREFKISGLFKISRPKRRSIKDYDKGDVPFVTTSKMNNGVDGLCTPHYDMDLDEGNCITVSPLDGTAFYQPDDFLGRGGGGSSIIILRLKKRKMNEEIGLFLATVLRVTLIRFSYADQISKDVIKKESISLPATKHGAPDWKYMEKYIKIKEEEAKEELDQLTK